MIYTATDARQFARIAHDLFARGENAMARATSQAFYDITRNQPNANDLHDVFQSEIIALGS